MTTLLATTRTLLSQDVLPTVLVFGVIVWLLVQYGRRAGAIDRSSGVNVVVPLRARLRLLLTTAVGGYGVFVVLAGGISLLAGETARYIGDALVGGAVLAFAVVTPIFMGATVLERRLEIRRAERLRS